MEKALRRQAGASTVDLDTLKGIAEYTIAGPMMLDFAKVERACHGAGYKLKQVDLEVAGEVKERQFIADGTGQEFTLDGRIPPSGKRRLRGGVRGWVSGRATLTVQGPDTREP